MRTPGIEPGLRAWKALIIASRSHPHDLGIKQLISLCFFLLNNNALDNSFYDKIEKKKKNLDYVKVGACLFKLSKRSKVKMGVQ